MPPKRKAAGAVAGATEKAKIDTSRDETLGYVHSASASAAPSEINSDQDVGLLRPASTVKKQQRMKEVIKTVREILAIKTGNSDGTRLMHAAQVPNVFSGHDMSMPLPNSARSLVVTLKYRRDGKQPASSGSPKATPLFTTDPKTRKDVQWTWQREKAVVATDPEILAQKIKEGFVFPNIPANDGEAIRLDRIHGNKRESDNSHIMQAIKGLDDRLKRRTSYLPNREREVWSRDFAKNGMSKDENWHQKSARTANAAAVNGIINSATLSPLGYGSDIRDLTKKRILSNGALLLADANADSIAKITRRHEETYLVPRSSQKIQRSVYDDDSSITGDESEQEEEEE